MLGRLIESSIQYSTTHENFENSEIMPDSIKNHPFAALLTLVIMWALVLFAGKYLWNNALVPLAPQSVKKASSVWQILGLSVLIQLMKC